MKITDQMFDDKLSEILKEQTGEQLLSITGIYEILAEHFNNEVIEEIEEDAKVKVGEA